MKAGWCSRFGSRGTWELDNIRPNIFTYGILLSPRSIATKHRTKDSSLVRILVLSPENPLKILQNPKRPSNLEKS